MHNYTKLNFEEAKRRYTSELNKELSINSARRNSYGTLDSIKIGQKYIDKILDDVFSTLKEAKQPVSDFSEIEKGIIDLTEKEYADIFTRMVEKFNCMPDLVSRNGILKKEETLESISRRIQLLQIALQFKNQAFLPATIINVNEDPIYQRILKRIHDVGKGFERLPSTYVGKEEEAIRDLMLLSLEPNFEGSATGETFNKSGKTDILLRHGGKNIFIAELKFWRGKKAYLESISQLLSYLTWRDSKSAVVVFVKNKEFSSVLETTKEATLEHENCLGFVAEQEKGWLHYWFHINGDKSSEVKLAVMLFHLPE